MDYKISTIIPIYNVEKYLDETIKSVIKQTIGFKNIQLILVNDGSPDNSDAICLKYVKKYPKNVVYIKQKNAGVSEARNNGMKYATGKYLNYLDADDKWDKNAYKVACDFLEKNQNIDVAICRMKYFEAKTDYHWLDFVFDKGNRICSREDEPKNIKMHISSNIIKTKVAKKIKFNKKIKYGEDGVYINQILLENNCFGILKDSLFYYRLREDETSAMNNQKKNKEYYIKSFENGWLNLLEYSKKKCGYIPCNIKYVLMYEMQWRLRHNDYIDNVLNTKEAEIYKKNIIKILKEIDDEIILYSKNLPIEYKLYCLILKHGKVSFKIKDNEIIYKNNSIFHLKNKKLGIRILDIVDNNLILEGKYILPACIDDKFKIAFKDVNKQKIHEIKSENINIYDEYAFDNELVAKAKMFKLKIPVDKIPKIEFFIKYDKREYKRCNMGFSKYAKLSKNIENYYHNKKYIIKYHKLQLVITKYTKKKNLKLEMNYQKQLKQIEMTDIIKLRKNYYLKKLLFKKKNILIIGKDNREIKIYNYLKNNCNYNIYLTEDKNKLKNLLLIADLIITYKDDKKLLNPFNDKRKYIQDLLKYKLVFLTKDKLTFKDNKYEKNYNLILTEEKENIIEMKEKKYYEIVKYIKLTEENIYKEITKVI